MINATSIKAWDKENTIIILLLLFSIITVYYLPHIISIVVFFIIFGFLSFKSKRDYFWIAFFFLLLDPPGNLFRSVEKLSHDQLPFIQVSSVQAIFFVEVIPFIFLIKALLKKGKSPFIFKNDFKILLGYLIIVLIYTLINFEMYYGKYYQLFIVVGYWSLLFSLPKLIKHEDIIRLDKLLFPFVFFAVILQVAGYFTGTQLINLFNPQLSKNIISTSGGFEVYRISSNIVIVLYCLIKASFYYFSKQKVFSSFYLIMIIITAITSIFLTATRGWIIGMFIFLAVVFFMFSGSQRKFKRLVSIILTLIGLFLTTSLISPSIRTQIYSSWERLTTISLLLEGDQSAGGTLSRLTDRRVPMEEVFRQKPIFGWGFSETFFEFDDHHVGMLIILLNVGIVGLTIFILFFIRWLYKIWQQSKNRIINSLYGNSLIVFAAGLLFVFTIHNSSRTMWGFYLPYESDRLLIVLLFVSLNAAVLHAYSNWKTK